MPGSPKLQKYNIFSNPYLNVHSVVLIAAAFGVLGLVLTRSLLAASDVGTVTGKVSTTSDVALVGANVQVVDSAGNTIRNIHTDESGAYAIGDIAVGLYNFSVSEPHHMTTKTDVEVTGGETVVKNFQLDKK